MEKILFIMPDDGEIFLAALAAVQAWIREQDEQIANALNHISKIAAETDASHKDQKLPFGKYQMMLTQLRMARDQQEARRWELVIHMSSKYDDFRPAFGNNVIFFPECVTPNRGYYDLVFKFDPDRAYDLAKATERHMAASFGIMLGVESGSLPDLSAMRVEHAYQPAVVFLPSADLVNVAAFVTRNRPDSLTTWLSNDCCSDDLFSADMVVGPRSLATYFASALGKRVVELSPEDGKHKRWLSKWDNPNYQMIRGTDFPPALVYRTMEQLWRRPIRPIVRDQSSDIVRKRIGLTGLSAAFSHGGL